ncbi:hypothetical protein [Lutibacter sp.]
MKKVIFSILLSVLVISCNDYGEKVTYNGTDVYYKNGVTEAQAHKLGKYLEESEFADGAEKSVQLVIDENTNNLTFRMVTIDEAINDSSYDIIFKNFMRELSELFDNKPVDIHLCNDSFETVKTYSFSELPKYVFAKKTQILYTKYVTEEEAIKLKDFLIAKNFADDANPKTVELSKEGDTYLFRMVVKEGSDKNEASVIVLKFFGEAIAKNVFDNKPLKVHMCNTKMETLKVIDLTHEI